MGDTRNNQRSTYEQSAFTIAYKVLKNTWNKNRKLIYTDLIITGVGSVVLSGYLYQIAQRAAHKIQSVSFMGVLGGGLRGNIVLTAVFFLGVNWLMYKLLMITQKETVMDEERNYNASTAGYNGTARKMSDDEKEWFFIHGDYAEINGNVLGADTEDIMKMYALNDEIYGINHNWCIVGAPGIGKSRCYGIPIILNTIQRGESLICTDPKGELYRETAAVAKAHGYTVKILNFNPERLLHSDSCDYMSVIGTKTHVAQSFSKTVIDNTNDGKDSDFWSDSEFSFFMGCCLIIATNEIGLPKTLGGIYQLLNTNTVDSFELNWGLLPDTHPAKPFINTWANGDKTVKGNTYAGLQIRLSALAMPIVQKVVSTPDIDFLLPGKEKCIYYIASSDSDPSMNYLVALFFTLLYQQLTNYADSTDEGYLPVRVTMLLDEFKNIGRIPFFSEKLSTVRSRHIDTIMILQDLGQLQQMYPDNEWETILNDCHVRILLSTNNLITSNYFSELSGDQTTEERGESYTEQATDLIKLHNEKSVRISHGKRYLYTPEEIRTLDFNRVIVFMGKCKPVEMLKIDYSNHPMCQEMRKWVALKHLPNWVRTLTAEERKMFGVGNEIYQPEVTDDIVLCTKEDMKHPWNKEKAEHLKQYIMIEKAKRDKAALERRRAQRG